MRTHVLAIAAAVALQLFVEPLGARNTNAAPSDTLALSLEESVRLALANNSDIRVGREKVREAAAGVGEAGTAFLPQITGSAGYTRLDMAPYIPTSRIASILAGIGGAPPGRALPDKITLGLPDNYAASLELRQPLFAAGRIRNAYDISKLARSEAESELDRSSSEIAFEAKRAYLECVQAQKLEDVALETVRQLEAHLKDIQAMSEAGLAAANDVLKTKVYYSDAKLALMRSKHAVTLAKKDLCNIIDVPLAKEIVLTTAADSVAGTEIDLDAAVRNGIARRPELALIACRKLMARKEIETSRNGYLPTVSFFADLSYQYPDRNYAKDFNSSWKLGVVAQMNVFDWGRTVYQTRQSRSRLTEIETTERSIRDAVTLDVTRTYLTLLDAWDAIQVAREGLAQANENHRVTLESFKEGLATNTDLLDAEVLLTASKTNFHTLTIEYMIAQADLERATGGTQ
ncbi:MAG: TolC family protein [Candidatus Krumholzibacteriaceae bacterium]